MKSTYCEYIFEKILSTSEVGSILALIAPSPLSWKIVGIFSLTEDTCIRWPGWPL